MFHYYTQTPHHETVFELITSVPLGIGDLVAVNDFDKELDDQYRVIGIQHSAHKNTKHSVHGFVSTRTYVKLEKIQRI